MHTWSLRRSELFVVTRQVATLNCVCVMSTHGVALVRIQDAGLKRAARGSLKIQDGVRVPNCGVEQRAPPIFGRAAITLGTGPHSSFHCSQQLSIYSATTLMVFLLLMMLSTRTQLSSQQ